jgi:hypothetical protein
MSAQPSSTARPTRPRRGNAFQLHRTQTGVRPPTINGSVPARDRLPETAPTNSPYSGGDASQNNRGFVLWRLPHAGPCRPHYLSGRHPDGSPQ